MAAPFWIGTSWKMNKTLAEAAEYTRAIAGAEPLRDPRIRPFVIPPFTALARVCAELAASPVLVGAQNMHWAERGAFTGEVSPLMVADCGADIVELGHSERREYFNETDAAVNRKVLAALEHGLRPLVCIGETAEERRLGVAVETVVRQAKIALHGVDGEPLDRVLIAYEPVWAIGEHGRPATPEDVSEIHDHLSALLPKRSNGERVPLLYGGSVNPDNASVLAALPAVDGLFIGRSAWSASGYLGLVEQVLAVIGD